MGQGLTKIAVERMKPGSSRREIADGLLPGFYLVIQTSGKKSWACRYRFAGRPRKFTIGRYPKISLETARDLARAAFEQVAKGIDPFQAKQAARRPAGPRTVQEVADQYIEMYAKTHTKESSWAETKRALDNYVIARWKNRLLASITKFDVVELLDEIVKQGTPAMANRTFAAIRGMCNWARDQRGILTVSPCEGISAPAPSNPRTRVLNTDELQKVVTVAHRPGYIFGHMIRLLILTAARRDEMAEARWEEVNFEEKLWIIPGERTKNKLPLAIPLVNLIHSELTFLPTYQSAIAAGVKPTGYLFVGRGGKPASNFSKNKEAFDAKLREKYGDFAPWRIHDLRRTARTNFSAIGIASIVSERLLNHVPERLHRIYDLHDYLDQKIEALGKWHRFVWGLYGFDARLTAREVKEHHHDSFFEL